MSKPSKSTIGDGAAEVPAALPGSVSAARAEPLATTWDERLTTWGDDVGAFGTGLAAAADRYAADEAAARQDFSVLGGLFGEIS